MALLFKTATDNINLHLKNIYKDGELEELATTEPAQKDLMIRHSQFAGRWARMSKQNFNEFVVDDGAVAWLAICLIRVHLKIPGPLQSL